MNYTSYSNVITLHDGLGIRLREPETRRGSYYRLPYQPRTFTLDNGKPTQWRTMEGQAVKEYRHADAKAYREFIKLAEESGQAIFGVISPVQQFMAEEMPHECGVPFEDLRTVYIDIEVESEGGFAPVEDPWQPITAITVEVWGHFYVWGTGEFQNNNPDTVTYHHCKNEVDMIHSFFAWWTSDYPDIVTGWNVEGYDMPYVYMRTERLRKEKKIRFAGSIMSPWKKVGQKKVRNMGGREDLEVDIMGVSVLDYLNLYKRYSGTQKVSYRLGDIAKDELGETKIDYSEYGSLKELMSQNYQKYIEYNIQDVALVSRLNAKRHFLELTVQLAYSSRVNFTDTFKQVRMWDAITFYELYDRGIVVPPKIVARKLEEYAGAYVKDPIVGKHKWVVSFDINSLYPSIMREWNISPDRHLTSDWLEKRKKSIAMQHGALEIPLDGTESPVVWRDEVSKADAPKVLWSLTQLINQIQTTSVDLMLQELKSVSEWPWLKFLNVNVTPNQQVFRSDEEGFMPGILTRMYAERKKYKDLMTASKKKAAKVETEKNKYLASGDVDPAKVVEYDAQIKKHNMDAVMYDTYQNARKTALNSCYGALGSEYFRFYDLRHAQGVTVTGQMIIQKVAQEVNLHLNDEFKTSADYILASDTDSIYVKLAPLVQPTWGLTESIDKIDAYCEGTIQPILNTTFADIHQRFNTLAPILAMKRESIAEHGVWTAKKRYLLWEHDNEGARHAEPKLKIVGIEAVRSSTPKLGQQIIKKALEYFIQDKKAEFHALIDKAEKDFMSRPFEDIASPRSCNNLDEYDTGTEEFEKSTPIHVKGSLAYNRYLDRSNLTHKYEKIRSGEKIRFCYLKPANPLRVNVIAAPHALPVEWKLEPFLDRVTQFEKTVLNSLENIVSVAGWTIKPSFSFDMF